MNKYDPDLVAYMKAICRGPLLASTVHNAIVEAADFGLCGCSVGSEAFQSWLLLRAKHGAEEADKAVRDWIDKPYQLSSAFVIGQSKPKDD